MPDITEPLTLARGSHKAGSGKGCAMNVISWENGDTEITDFPECSDPFLAMLVQRVNDELAGQNGLLNAKDSIVALDLGHATVGTAYHGLRGADLVRVYARVTLRQMFGLTVPSDPFWVTVRMWLEGSGSIPAIEHRLFNGPDRDKSKEFFTRAVVARTMDESREMFARVLEVVYRGMDSYIQKAMPPIVKYSWAGDEKMLYPSTDYEVIRPPVRGRYDWADLTRSIIADFHAQTGTTPKAPAPEVVACAVESMLATV